MADFSLPILFVIPVGNTLPTSGSTENLTDGQVGVFKDDARTAATAGNIGSATFIQIAQGRGITSPAAFMGSKISDKIKLANVKKWYKVTGNATAANEIWQFSDFTAGCDEQVTFTLRGHSKYLDTISFNGFTRSVTVTTPCCDCGDNPCDTVANETIIDLILAKIDEIASVQSQPNALNLTTFWTFGKIGTGDDAILQVESKPLTSYGKFCDVALNPWALDRIFFRGWVYKGPALSIDFIVADRCQDVATALLTQRSSFPRLTADDVAQMEIDYYSYQSDYKGLFRQSAYNQKFEEYVTAGTVYDAYYIIFDKYTPDLAWNPTPHQDETAIIAVPQALSAGLSTVLSAYLGTVVDESGQAISTSTTSTTTSTSTTTTTTLIP
jgi:hypothetical protein